MLRVFSPLIFYGEKVASNFQDRFQRGAKAFTVYPNEDGFRRKRFYSIVKIRERDREREREGEKYSNIRMTAVSRRKSCESTRIDLFVDGWTRLLVLISSPRNREFSRTDRLIDLSRFGNNFRACTIELSRRWGVNDETRGTKPRITWPWPLMAGRGWRRRGGFGKELEGYINGKRQRTDFRVNQTQFRPAKRLACTKDGRSTIIVVWNLSFTCSYRIAV